MNVHGIGAIFKFEMARFFRTLFQSIASPVLSTSLYFIVFGSAIDEMFESVSRVGKLPAETKIWCGHEYTKNNLRWESRRWSQQKGLRSARLFAKLYPKCTQIVTVFPDRMDRYFSTELFRPFREEVEVS